MATILVIDDDPDFLDTTRVVLEDAGYTVETAMTGEDAIASIRRAAPDLAVLDVMMPDDLEGFTVARQIREDLGLRDLPIVILTSLHERRQVPYRFAPDAHYLPVDVFLDKPVQPAQLVATVGDLLGDRRDPSPKPL